MEGIAFDIAMANQNPEAFEAAARAVGFQGFGFYPRSGFMHIDLGPARSWGERFPKRATAFAAETQPVREVLSESRTLKGGGAAGVTTVGAAGVEVAQQVLAETQGAVLPLVPYLGTACAELVHRGGARRHRSCDLRAHLMIGSRVTAVIAGLTQPPVPQAAACCGSRPARRARRPPRDTPPAARLPPLGRERLGRLLEQRETLERSHDVQREMLEAAARRPRDRGELAERLRNGRF